MLLSVRKLCMIKCYPCYYTAWQHFTLWKITCQVIFQVISPCIDSWSASTVLLEEWNQADGSISNIYTSWKYYLHMTSHQIPGDIYIYFYCMYILRRKVWDLYYSNEDNFIVLTNVIFHARFSKYSNVTKF